MRKCSKCKLEKTNDEFYRRANGNLRLDCKSCLNKRVSERSKKRFLEISNYKKKYYLENKQTIREERKDLRKEKVKIIELNKNKECLDCGKKFPSCAMDFDHRNPKDKKVGISKILNTNYSVDVLLEELDKCDLVCACCHRTRTQNWFNENKKNKRNYPERERRKALVDGFKNKPCLDCGNKFKTWQMDFDHLKDKRNSISKLILNSVSDEEIVNEIEKCELVCVNCHRMRTQKRNVK